MDIHTKRATTKCILPRWSVSLAEFLVFLVCLIRAQVLLSPQVLYHKNPNMRGWNLTTVSYTCIVTGNRSEQVAM